MKFKIKFADQIVGLFIIVALASSVITIIFIGANQRWFARDYHFTTIFNSATGISPGTAILLKGFTIGKIDKLELTSENTIFAKFHIFDTYYDKVREFSILEFSVSPIGGLGSQLLFHPGKSETILAEGSLIPNIESDEGQTYLLKGLVEIPPKDDTITKVISQLNIVLDEIGKVSVSTNRVITEVSRVMAGQSSGTVGDIVTDASHIIADIKSQTKGMLEQINGLLAEVRTIGDNIVAATNEIRDPTGLVPKLLDPSGSIKTFLNDDNELYKKVIGIVGNLEKSIKNIQSILSGVDTEMPKIAGLLNETRMAIEQATDVLEGIKNNPLIRDGISTKVKQETINQALREGEF